MSNTAQSAVIARELNDGTSFAFAKIDEVRVYNKELSDAEIRYIYNKGGPAMHYKFDEGSGGTAYDSSGNLEDGGGKNTGALQDIATSTIWVSGKYGTALDLDGTDDFLVIGDSITASFGAAFNQLMHTGQVNCWDGSGVARACAGTNEDAYVDGTPKIYKDAGCGANTVVDMHTGLCWQKDDAPASGIAWDNAIDYCRTLSLGGHSDWRLPNAIEAATMMDNSCANNSEAHCVTGATGDYQNSAFNWGANDRNYWTSTTQPDSSSIAYVVNAVSGNLNNFTKTISNFVRCVRIAM
jgi:hypothetical protein